MSAARIFIRWTCVYCAYVEQSGRKELVGRLRDLGMLRRDDGRDVPLLLELAAGHAAELKCPRCDRSGFLPEIAAGDDFDGPPAKPCMACGKPIPRERLELFPDSDLCANCQGAVDGGQSLSGDDYCPHCGTPMVVRKTSGGVTRSRQVCPQCRR